MGGVPSTAGQQDQLREVVAHLGSALDQSDYTDDQIIIGHLRSAHDLALNALRSGASSGSPSIVPIESQETVYLVEIVWGRWDVSGERPTSARPI
jgi:hypothetical protein